jgi:ATP-dependent protease HslVU (ClpYQ) peptidase subunit
LTTIIGIQGDGFCIATADSRISDVENESGLISQIVSLKESNSKLGLNGRYILAAAGDLRAINILHHAFVPPKVEATIKGKKLDQFVTTKFIPSLRECFELQGYAAPQNENSEHIAEHSSTILMAINGTIYIIDGDYSWISDPNGLYAIGTGAQYALGSMYAMLPRKGKLNVSIARKIAIRAIAVAAKFDPYTGSPYHTIVQGIDQHNARTTAGIEKQRK